VGEGASGSGVWTVQHPISTASSISNTPRSIQTQVQQPQPTPVSSAQKSSINNPAWSVAAPAAMHTPPVVETGRTVVEQHNSQQKVVATHDNQVSINFNLFIQYICNFFKFIIILQIQLEYIITMVYIKSTIINCKRRTKTEFIRYSS
jgi:hypothetical protein